MRIQRARYDSRGHRLTRVPVSACLLEEIERHITATRKKFNVSRSFVIAVALADYFGITEQETFTDVQNHHSTPKRQRSPPRR